MPPRIWPSVNWTGWEPELALGPAACCCSCALLAAFWSDKPPGSTLPSGTAVSRAVVWHTLYALAEPVSTLSSS